MWYLAVNQSSGRSYRNAASLRELLQLLRYINVNRIEAGTAATVAAIRLRATNHGKITQCGKVPVQNALSCRCRCRRNAQLISPSSTAVKSK